MADLGDARQQAVDELQKIRSRWSTSYDRGAHDYTDEGCRILAEHAFRDVGLLLMRVQELTDERDAWRDAFGLTDSVMPLRDPADARKFIDGLVAAASGVQETERALRGVEDALIARDVPRALAILSGELGVGQ